MRALSWLCGWIALGAVGCYSPRHDDCALTCTALTGCPLGLTCDGHGWCRTSLDGPACAGRGGADAAHGPADGAPGAPDATPAADAAPPCVCDPLAQSCCTGGEACDVPPPELTPVCREATPGGTQAVPCAAPTHCAVAHTCLVDEAPTLGTCHRFCDDDADCAGGGGVCETRVGAALVQVCTTDCDPLTAQGCPEAFTCVLDWLGRGGGRAWTDCRVRGNGRQGDPCGGHDDCRRGHFCRAGGDGRDEDGGPSGPRCVEYCRALGGGAQGDCPGPTRCEALDEEPVFVGGLQYGWCKRG